MRIPLLLGFVGLAQRPEDLGLAAGEVVGGKWGEVVLPDVADRHTLYYYFINARGQPNQMLSHVWDFWLLFFRM